MIRPRRTVDDSTPTATLMTRLRRTVDDPTPTAWLGVVTVSNMVSVEGYTRAHPTEDFKPPTVEVLPIVRGDAVHGDRFDVRLLEPGDQLYCYEAHAGMVVRELGEVTFRPDPEYPDGLLTDIRKPVVHISWHALGLRHPEPDKPPPKHFRLVKLDDDRMFEIEHTLHCSLLHLDATEDAAREWSQQCAQKLLTRYRHNRKRLRHDAA